MSSNVKVPARQIRAQFTDTTITVYQAYNSEIASAAVQHQKLNASSKFSTSRMTWIKPSWAWMLYRSGYSYKDPGQERILALTMARDAFVSLLQKSITSQSRGHETAPSMPCSNGDAANKAGKVRVQWDPERTVRLQKLEYRSIQIGVPGALIEVLVHGIVKIEDVTERARELKRMLDEHDTVDNTVLEKSGLVPVERIFEVNAGLRSRLGIEERGTDATHDTSS